jgi:alpha-N-arabinofuranosidase
MKSTPGKDHGCELRCFLSPFKLVVFLIMVIAGTSAGVDHSSAARIDVDASRPVGTVSKYIFGQNLEHEHGAVSGGEQNLNHEHGLHTGGLWAEMLRDRKFEEGALDGDGVANGWVPEERITNRYEELVDGQGVHDRYRIDHEEFYGGGAAQSIEVYGAGANHASIYQIGLHFSKGRRYVFYVYLKRRGTGAAFVEFDRRGRVYGRTEFKTLSDAWSKYTAEFIASEDTDDGRVRIAAQGNGTFWIDSASLMGADNYHGMRADLIEAVKALKATLLRYPGGCFADSYHWKDGVGDRDRRPERWSYMWNEWEPNDFGTDEYMEFLRLTGMEPHITTNYLTGTAQEAAQWVQYANGSAETPMGRLRARNGHPEPYGVKLWAVGNEVQQLCSDQYIGANDVNRYAERFKEYRSRILEEDPSVRVMAVGAGPGPLQWNHDLLTRVPDAGPLGLSIYTGEGSRIDDFDTKIMDLNHFYRHLVAEPLDFDHQLSDAVQSIGKLSPQNHPLLAVTEFQAWWLTEKVDEDFRLCNALYVASIYNSLLRRAKEVSIAEIESLINVQGIIEASQTSLKLTPEYFACLLYRLHTGDTVVSTSTESSMVDFNPRLSMLDSIATLSDGNRTLHLAVVNRDEDHVVNTRIRVQGWAPATGTIARVFELNGKDKVAANPFGSTENVNIREKSFPVSEPAISYNFPPHSVTIVELSRGR